MSSKRQNSDTSDGHVAASDQFAIGADQRVHRAVELGAHGRPCLAVPAQNGATVVPANPWTTHHQLILVHGHGAHRAYQFRAQWAPDAAIPRCDGSDSPSPGRREVPADDQQTVPAFQRVHPVIHAAADVDPGVAGPARRAGQHRRRQPRALDDSVRRRAPRPDRGLDARRACRRPRPR